MKLTDGDMDRISGFHITDLVTDPHPALTGMNVVNFFHGIHVSDEYLSGRDIGMGKKHQSLKMPGVENHVSNTAPMGSVASGFDFRVFQVASYHWFVLSDDSSFVHDILIDN